VSRQAVIDNAEGFDTVRAWLAPNGDLIVDLTHHVTDDHQVLLRVRGDADVIDVGSLSPEEWENPESQLGRLNHGGNWDG
jgi:hypothetical protein